MSERGSFVTDYIDCDKCFAAVKTILLKDDKFLRGVTIPSWTGDPNKELPIIAGKVGGHYSGEELVIFERELVPALAEVVCHQLRIAVLAENSVGFLTVRPVSPQ